MTDAPTSTAPTRQLVDDLSFLLARASALSNAAGNAALAPHGLKVRSYSVLELAAESTQTSQREIAEFLRLDPSQVVALVDELQRVGLVAREPDPRDRRANAIIATPLGQDLLVHARRSLQTTSPVTRPELTDAERETLTSLLRKVAFPA